MRVGVVGGGPMAHAHLSMIRQVPGAEVVGIADPNQTTLAETGDKFGIAARFPGIQELIAAGSPQVLHIVTPTHTHLPLTLAALAAGCHVYVEKPMGVNLREVEEMLAAAEKHERLLCVGHNFLYDPVVRVAREAIDRGEIGDVCGIESYFGMDLGTNPKSRYYGEAYKHWAYHMPGSLQQNIMDHPLALVVPFMGEPTQVHTVAAGGVLPEGIASELRMVIGDGKVLASVTGSFAASPRFHYVRYLGTHATLHVDLQNQRLSTYGHREGIPHFATRAMMNLSESAGILGNTFATVGKVVTRKFTPFEGVRDLAAALYRAIESGGESPVPAEHARRVARLMDTAWEAMAAQGFALAPAKVRAKQIAAEPAPAWKERKKGVTRSVVTGATGFIGTRLVRALCLRPDEDVRGLVRNEFRGGEVRASGAHVVEADLRDPDGLERGLEGADVVYHLGAAMGGTANDYLEITVRGTERLIQAAAKHGVKKLVYVSTIAVYGVPDRGPVTETFPYAERDLSPYVSSKIEAEKLIVAQAAASGLQATILRPGVVYAPGHRVSRIGYPLLGGRYYVIIGLNDIALPAVYVDDLVDAMILAGRSEKSAGQTYNVVSPVRLTQTQYLKLLSEYGGKKVGYVRFPYTIAAAMGGFFRGLSGVSPIFGKVGSLLGSTFLRSCSRHLEYTSAKIQADLGWAPEPDLVAHFKTKGRFG